MTSRFRSELTFGTAPRADSYDAIVIGAGIGGLSAAAFLAYAGKRVLVVERHTTPGGYAHAFTRGPYTFDPAVHVTGDSAEDGLPPALYRLLGVGDMVDFQLTESWYKASFPDVTLDVPFLIDPYIEAHQRLFPQEAAAIEKYFRLCVQLHHEAHVLPPALGLDKLDEAARRYPVLFKYLRATIEDAVSEHLSDPRMRALGSALWPYIGSPPSEGSLITYATHLSVLVDGVYYPRGSAQTMVDALCTAVVRHGGEIVVERSAEQIILEDGRAVGVAISGGERVSAPVVVSAVAAPMTFEQLVGLEHLPSGFVRRHRRLRPGLSAVIFYAATSLDLAAMGAQHENFLSLHTDPEEARKDILAGKPGGMWAAVPTLGDPSLAPAGEHAITITSIARHDAETWRDDLEGYKGAVLEAWEQVFPGLRQNLTFLEVATPRALERFTGNTNGACYGWDNIPSQTGGRRSPHVTPIGGLYLSGHWTQPGSGTMRTLVSGFHTAQMILAAAGEHPIHFHHETMPPETDEAAAL
jgi:prolycopene isomerase